MQLRKSNTIKINILFFTYLWLLSCNQLLASLHKYQRITEVHEVSTGETDLEFRQRLQTTGKVNGFYRYNDQDATIYCSKINERPAVYKKSNNGEKTTLWKYQLKSFVKFVLKPKTYKDIYIPSFCLASDRSAIALIVEDEAYPHSILFVYNIKTQEEWHASLDNFLNGWSNKNYKELNIAVAPNATKVAISYRNFLYLQELDTQKNWDKEYKKSPTFIDFNRQGTKIGINSVGETFIEDFPS